MGRDKRPSEIYFTIVASNYLSYAESLMESLQKHAASAERIIVLCDEPSNKTPTSQFADIKLARCLGLDDFPAMALHYDVMELSTAIKPTVFLNLFAAEPDAHITYLDPDILVTAPLDHVARALAGGASMVLTPHITAPLQDGRMPDDLTIMKSGIYNLGFVAFRSTEESLAFLRWWQSRCARDAIVDIADNKFTDQRWVDMAPAFVQRTHILHHHSYNLAYWNLAHRRVTRARGRVLVDGEALRFVHFSGVNAGDRTQFSKHQNRFSADTLGQLRPLFDAYVDRLVAHGWNTTRHIPYAYGRFGSGRMVHPMMRQSFRRHRDAMDVTQAWQAGAIFDSAEPSVSALGPPSISRVMYELWQRRADLAAKFDIHSASGRQAYLQWFVHGGALDSRFDEASISAARAMTPSDLSPLKPILPWPPQRRAVHQAGRDTVDAWLACPVPLNVITTDAGVPVPRQIALLWEHRDDLSRHFQCQTIEALESYVFWCITNGVAEKGVDLDLMAPTLSPYLSAAEDAETTTLPPWTRLMRVAAPHYDGPFGDLVRNSPDSDVGRLALALWLIGPATRRHGWPASFNAVVRGWLARRAPPFPSDGLPIPNLLYALWLLRTDVRERYDIQATGGQLEFLSWVVNYGLREMQIAWQDLPEDLRGLLHSPANPADPNVRLMHVLAPLTRDKLRAAFPASDRSSQYAMVQQLDRERDDEWAIGTLVTQAAARQARLVVCTAEGPTQVLLTGLVDVASGRGEDVRMSGASLAAAGLPFTYLDRQTGRYSSGEESATLAARGRYPINIVHLNAETAMDDYLFLRHAGASQAYTIGYWAWELSKFPADWTYAFAFYDEIWASTRFAFDSFSSASYRPVTLMPMAVEMPSVDPKLGRSDFGLPEAAVLFFFSFDFRSYLSRKNPLAIIEAFKQAFPKNDEKVALVIKTLGSTTKPADRAALATMVGSDQRIFVIDREFDPVQFSTLVSLCDCFVSLHRSEGFGRGPAEAMLLGKPVIATNYSGNIDFMNTSNSLLVDYDMVPLADGAYPGGEGQAWADPNVTMAARHMRTVADDRATATRIGRAAATYMMRTHNREVIGKTMRERLLAIDAAGTLGLRGNRNTSAPELRKT